jgi:hypothetical protein
MQCHILSTDGMQLQYNNSGYEKWKALQDMGVERRGGRGGDGPKSKQMEYLASALRASVNNKNYTRASKSSFSFFKEESLFRVRWHTSSVGVGAAVSVVFPRHPRSPLLDRRSDPLSFPFVFVPFKEEAIAP